MISRNVKTLEICNPDFSGVVVFGDALSGTVTGDDVEGAVVAGADELKTCYKMLR